MIQKPPITPVRAEQYGQYFEALFGWLTQVYGLLREYELRRQVFRVVADYTTSADDRTVAVTDTTAPRTITISSSLIAKVDVVVVVADESGNASVNNITVATEGTEKINGADTATIATDYGSVILQSDGSNLFTRSL